MNEKKIKRMRIMLVLEAAILFIAGIVSRRNQEKNESIIKKDKIDIQKDNLIMEALIQWVQIEHERKSVSRLLQQMGYEKISIYGYGYIGRELEKILQEDEIIHLLCVIDKSVPARVNGERILKPDEKLPNADALVVTSLYYYEEIQEELRGFGVQADIISIDALLYQL